LTARLMIGSKFIDDATSELLHLRFEPSETTAGYFRSVRACVKKHGIPLAFYSDKDSVFVINFEKYAVFCDLNNGGLVVEQNNARA